MTSSQPTKVGGFLDEETLLEELAELEHEQWWKWSDAVRHNLHPIYRYLAEVGDINSAEQGLKWQFERWQKNWKPYAELDEKTKEQDRIWARKVLDIVKRAEARRAPPTSEDVSIRTEDTL